MHSQGRSPGVRARKEAVRRVRDDATFKGTIAAMTSRFDVVGKALMDKADTHLGKAMKDMERTMVSSVLPESDLFKKIMFVMEQRWEERLEVAGDGAMLRSGKIGHESRASSAVNSSPALIGGTGTSGALRTSARRGEPHCVMAVSWTGLVIKLLNSVRQTWFWKCP